MKDYSDKHSFVICAYQESPYLESCINSILRQSVTSAIIMVTSTPNEHIQSLAKKYNLPLIVNRGERGMVQDWNFGLSQCLTPYVTIAHQDDIYFTNYAKIAVEELSNRKQPLIFFSDYVEIRGKSMMRKSGLLKLKRCMLSPLRWKSLQRNIFVRRRILSLGNPICCPSVTYAIDYLPSPVFGTGFRSNQDWEAWELVSRRQGEFVYSHRKLIGHRIHSESETSILIGENMRNREDYKMFCKLWPRWIAKLLAKIYAGSEKFNENH